MSNVISTQLFSWAFYGVVLFLLCLAFVNRFRRLAGFFMHGIMGSSFILIINCLMCQLDICLGINFFTVSLSALLGLPGIGLMYLMLYIL